MHIEIGKMARLNYPDGILIEHIEQPDVAVAETRRLIVNNSRVPLFEAALEFAGVLVRADILVPVDGGWRMIEVKSSGSVKDHHLIDCAVQLWVLEGTGVKVQQVFLAHVDTSFVYAGDGNYGQLLVDEDVTEKVRALLPAMPTSHRDIPSRHPGRFNSHCPNGIAM
jgi:predicted RecB family nuclease